MNPEMLMYMQQQPQASHRGAPEETTATPFSAGALAAIKSAKQSLGMDEEEQRRAMGLAIAKFFSGMAQPGHGPGIEGALGAAASNIAPALEAYQGEENRVAGLNSALLKQHTDYGIEQQKMRQQVVERLLKQAHMNAKQTETERHNKQMEGRQDALLSLKQAKLNKDMPQSVTIAGKEYSPITSKSERAGFVKDQKGFAHNLKDLSSIKKHYDEFRKLTKGNFIDPQAPYYAGTLANEAKDFMGSLTGNKKQLQETAKRKALNAMLGLYTVNAERRLKGGNLGESILKRFEKKELFPSLSDRPEVFEQKLNDMIKEAEINEKAASTSLKTGLIISPLDMEEESAAVPSEGGLARHGQVNASEASPSSLENVSTEELLEKYKALTGNAQ
jgi:hypothetical protein